MILKPMLICGPQGSGKTRLAGNFIGKGYISEHIAKDAEAVDDFLLFHGNAPCILTTQLSLEQMSTTMLSQFQTIFNLYAV